MHKMLISVIMNEHKVYWVLFVFLFEKPKCVSTTVDSTEVTHYCRGFVPEARSWAYPSWRNATTLASKRLFILVLHLCTTIQNCIQNTRTFTSVELYRTQFNKRLNLIWFKYYTKDGSSLEHCSTIYRVHNGQNI